MLVCICHGITDRDIDTAILEGASNFKDVSRSLGVGNCCGNCAGYAKDMVQEKIQGIQSAQLMHLAYELAM